MPLPKPEKDEDQQHFVSRCIAFERGASPDRPLPQVQAMCFEAWRNRDVKQEASDRSWASVDKSKLPASCFLWVEDSEHPTTWHLPVYEGAGGIDPDTGRHRSRGPINLGALRAAVAAVAGARTGKSMNVPASVRAKLNGLLERYKIGEHAEK